MKDTKDRGGRGLLVLAWTLALGAVAAASTLAPVRGVVAVRSASEVDGALEGAWGRAQLTPATPAPAAAWLRRVWLDLAGVIPPPDTVRAFTADARPDARLRVIAGVLARPEWAAHWGQVLAPALVVPRAEPDASVARTLERAVGERLAGGATWPAIVRGLILGGEPGGLGAFRGQFAEAPHEVAGQLGSAVFGMRLRCAQCHDDPLQGWKVADFYGLAAFFGTPRRANVPSKLFEAWKAGKVRNMFDLILHMPDMRPKGADQRWVRQEIDGCIEELRQFARMGLGDGPIPDATGTTWTAYDVFRIHAERRARNMDGFGQRVNLVFDRDGSALLMPPLPASPLAAVGAPIAGTAVTPRWPNEPGRPAPLAGERRAALAAWAGDPANPLVAKAFVNRVWAALMGRGLVEPVDEVVRPADARHAELLERLAAGFSEQNGDVRWLLSTIMTTRAYAMDCGASGAVPLASHPLTRAHHGMEIELGATAPAEKVDPERMFAVRRARPLTGPEVEASLCRATGRANGSPELSKALARTFDPTAGAPVVDEAGARQGGLQRGLFLLTGPELQKLVEDAPLLSSLAHQPTPAQALEELFMRTLGRPPEPGERERLTPHLARLPAGDARRPWADTLWALVSSAEFLSNH